MRREYPAVLYRTALAAFLSVTLAGAATATTTQSADPVDAMIYPVSLTASNACGTEEVTVDVVVLPSPTADFGPDVDTFRA